MCRGNDPSWLDSGGHQALSAEGGSVGTRDVEPVAPTRIGIFTISRPAARSPYVDGRGNAVPEDTGVVKYVHARTKKKFKKSHTCQTNVSQNKNQKEYKKKNLFSHFTDKEERLVPRNSERIGQRELNIPTSEMVGAELLRPLPDVGIQERCTGWLSNGSPSHVGRFVDLERTEPASVADCDEP